MDIISVTKCIENVRWTGEYVLEESIKSEVFQLCRRTRSPPIFEFLSRSREITHEKIKFASEYLLLVINRQSTKLDIILTTKTSESLISTAHGEYTMRSEVRKQLSAMAARDLSLTPIYKIGGPNTFFLNRCFPSLRSQFIAT